VRLSSISLTLHVTSGCDLMLIAFQGFAFMEFSLLLISNVPMPEIAKRPPLDQRLDFLQTDGQDHSFKNFGRLLLDQEPTFI
jgi:hypothetical protein